MGKTINIIGDTAKEQWLNAIGLYKMVIESNLGVLEHAVDEDVQECVLASKRVLDDFADEMRRLVEGVMWA